MLTIAGYIWREEVVDKLAWKHNVATYEVEEVFKNRPRIQRIAKGHYEREDVYSAAGRRSDAGRYLIVIFIYKRSKQALINTARDMTAKEKQRYGKK